LEPVHAQAGHRYRDRYGHVTGTVQPTCTGRAQVQGQVQVPTPYMHRFRDRYRYLGTYRYTVCTGRAQPHRYRPDRIFN
jgi:hypothetical protein